MYHEQLEQARVSQSSQGGETSRLAANSTIRATPNSNTSHSANASAANGAGIKSFPPGLGFDKSKSAIDIEKVQIDPIKRTSPGECRNSLMIFNNVLSSVNLNDEANGGPSTEADQRNICRLTMRWVAKDSEIVTDIRTWFGENPSEGTRVFNHVVEVFINASVRESAEAEKAILEFDWDGMVSKDGDFTRTKLNELWAYLPASTNSPGRPSLLDFTCVRQNTTPPHPRVRLSSTESELAESASSNNFIRLLRQVFFNGSRLVASQGL